MNMFNLGPKWVPLGVITWNTRIGLGFTKDTWDWVMENIAPVHVILLQEIRDVEEVRNVMGERWFVWPRLNPGTKATTVVAIRKKRFAIRQLTNEAMHSGRHDREILTIAADDRRSKRLMLFGSLHVDPLGAGFVNANVLARARHIKQVRAWADFVKGWFGVAPNGKLAFVGGDVNEQMDSEHTVAARKPKLAHLTAIAQLGAAGLVPAHRARKQRAHMDDVFAAGPGLRVVRRWQFTIPKSVDGAQHLDHALVYVCYGVRIDDAQ